MSGPPRGRRRRADLLSRVRALRRFGRFTHALTGIVTLGILGTLVALVAVFAELAAPAIQRASLGGFLLGQVWAPNREVFGALPALAGTLVTSAVALLLAIPLGVGFAVFVSEFAPGWLREVLTYLVDLAAAVPSIVYGFWGFLVLVPFMRYTVEPALSGATGGVGPFAGYATGLDVLTASVVLSAMVVPTIASLSREALRSIPAAQRESASSLGATRWEATRLTVLRPAWPSIGAAAILALGRALGETVAVALTIGGAYAVPLSLLSGGSTLASQIAVELPGALPPERSALVALGLLLLATSFLVNGVARGVLAGFLGRTGKAPWVVRALRRIGIGRDGSAGARMAALAAAPDAVSRRPALPSAEAIARRRARRHGASRLAILVSGAASLLVLVPFYSILHQAIVRGGRALLRPSFYTSPSAPPCLNLPGVPCVAGGVGPALEGTLILLALASLIAMPGGILAGIYLVEFGRGRFARVASYVIDVMAGIPSILIGLFVFLMFVTYDHDYTTSAYSAAIALGLVMIPIVTRSTEVALRSVPTSLREAAHALGFPRSRVAFRISLGTARAGIVSGALLAFARAAGETAAVLFTAGSGSQFIRNGSGLNGQVGSLPTLIYAYGQSGYSNWVQDAWGAALLLLLLMLAVSLVARIGLRRPIGAADLV